MTFFWSEIGSWFGEQGGIPPPRILRSNPQAPHEVLRYILSRYDVTLTVFVDKHWIWALIWVDSFAANRYNCNICLLDFFFFFKNSAGKCNGKRSILLEGWGDSLYNGPYQVLIGSCLNQGITDAFHHGCKKVEKTRSPLRAPEKTYWFVIYCIFYRQSIYRSF